MNATDRTMAVDCPVCNSNDTRQDFDFPKTMRCCNNCGADYIAEDGEIVFDPRQL